ILRSFSPGGTWSDPIPGAGPRSLDSGRRAGPGWLPGNLVRWAAASYGARPVITTPERTLSWVAVGKPRRAVRRRRLPPSAGLIWGNSHQIAEHFLAILSPAAGADDAFSRGGLRRGRFGWPAAGPRHDRFSITLGNEST